jgi:hypothetical protein
MSSENDPDSIIGKEVLRIEQVDESNDNIFFNESNFSTVKIVFENGTEVFASKDPEMNGSGKLVFKNPDDGMYMRYPKSGIND